MHVSPLRQKAFPFGEGVGFADGRGYCLPPFGEGVSFADRRGLYGGKCPPLGGVYLSFELNWEECRRRETLLSIEIQNGKEGLP